MTSRPTHAIYIMPQSSGNMVSSRMWTSLLHLRAQFYPIGTVGHYFLNNLSYLGVSSQSILQLSSITDLKAVFIDFASTAKLLFDWKGRVPVSSCPGSP